MRRLRLVLGGLRRSLSHKLMMNQFVKLCYTLTRTLDDLSQPPAVLGCLGTTVDNFACCFQNYLQVCDLDMAVNIL